MEIILGITAAIGWGVADFFARFASREIGAWRTQMYMQVFGATILSIYLALTGRFAHLFSLGWHTWFVAIVGGVINSFSSLSLYYAFEIGTMSVAAPVSSAYPAITVTLALLSGERIERGRAIGLAVIFAGILLAAISFGGGGTGPARDASDRAAAPATQKASRLVRGAGWAIISAVGFGVMFWWLGFHVVGELGGVGSVWAIRVSTLLTLMIAAAPTRQSVLLPQGKVWWVLAAVGLLDTIAFVSNNVGMRMGHVSVVTMLSSLYGAVTVVLGAMFVAEPLEKTQWAGIALIFGGIVLVNL